MTLFGLVQDNLIKAKEQLAVYERDTKEKEKEVVSLSKELEGKKDLIEEIKSSNDKMSKELEKANEVLDNKKGELETLKETITKIQTKAEGDSTCYEQALENEKQRVVERGKMRDLLEEEVKELKKKNNELRGAMSKLMNLDHIKKELEARVAEQAAKIDALTVNLTGVLC